MAQGDFYLKLDGVTGESKDSKHKNEIDIDSWQWGQSNAADAHERGGLGVGRVVVNDMQLASRISKASPVLMQDCANGAHHKNAILYMRKAGKDAQEFSNFKMYDVFITSYSISGDNGASLPTEHFSLTFSKFECEYKVQSETGTLTDTIKKGWNIRENKIA